MRPVRTLHLTSPHMEGADVHALQIALGVSPDGDYGPQTRDAVHARKYALGFPARSLDTGATPFFASIVEGRHKVPARYAPVARSRARYQAKHVNRLSEAVSILEKLVGTSEHPPSSNRGPGFIDDAQVHAGHGRFGAGEQGWPWCGCAVHESARRAGVMLDERFRSVEWIYDTARAGSSNLRLVGKDQARRGDVAILFSASTHTGWVRGPFHGGLLPTVEGNTSATSAGNQSNGGCVAEHERSDGEVFAIVRIHA